MHDLYIGHQQKGHQKKVIKDERDKGPSINYVRNFTCYLDPLPPPFYLCMLYAIEMYRRLDSPPPLPLGAYVINGRGRPLITYAPRGRGVKSPIHFHCVLHAKRGGGEGVQKAGKNAYVINGMHRSPLTI